MCIDGLLTLGLRIILRSQDEKVYYVYGWVGSIITYANPAQGLSAFYVWPRPLPQIAYMSWGIKQAGAELGQAQLKLGLDLNSMNLNEISFIVLVE